MTHLDDKAKCRKIAFFFDPINAYKLLFITDFIDLTRAPLHKLTCWIKVADLITCHVHEVYSINAICTIALAIQISTLDSLDEPLALEINLLLVLEGTWL